MSLTKQTNLQRALDAGWDVRPGTVQSINVKAPALSRGYVRYVLLQAGWVCDECGERLTLSQFTQHVRRIH